MNKNARKTGIITSLVILSLTIVFIILVSVFPAGEYDSAREFLLAFSPSTLLPVIPSFLLVMANIPFFVSLYYYAEEPEKPFAITGLLFGVAYAVCCGCNYFTQLTLVPQLIQLGKLSSLAVFSMHIRGSFVYSLDNLGYAFLAISFLFFSAIFSLRGFQGYIKSVFVVYGISGLLGTIGYITANSLLESFVFISAFPYFIAVLLMLIQFFMMKEKTN
ncbi:MAG: hypothetical protein JXR41_02465 [Bacteroidales bacterium]|nr:hypothetical protein [Bacteroidales bacterium]MBN2761927.1 hypothetical protein [Bacteroidales bacterium]